MKIVVLGAGAVGAYYGGQLARSGCGRFRVRRSTGLRIVRYRVDAASADGR